MDFGLPDNTLNLLIDFFKGITEIQKVKIYGSRAAGNYEKGSDIDIAFWSDSEKNLTGTILTGLDDLPTPYLFDVTDYNRLQHQDLKNRIDREGKILYEAEANVGD